MSREVQTIEKTSKSIKLWILLSTIGIIAGLLKGFGASMSGHPHTADSWWTLFIVSLIVRIGCGGARWWTNG